MSFEKLGNKDNPIAAQCNDFNSPVTEIPGSPILLSLNQEIHSRLIRIRRKS